MNKSYVNKQSAKSPYKRIQKNSSVEMLSFILAFIRRLLLYYCKHLNAQT